MRISDWSSDVCSSDLISSGPAPDEPTVALLNFKAMDVDAFIDWGMSQVGEPWDCGGGWRDFVHTDPRSALMLLARAARRGLACCPLVCSSRCPERQRRVERGWHQLGRSGSSAHAA